MKKLIPSLYVFLALISWSCSQEEEAPGVAMPANLQFTTTVSTTTEGQVDVAATAILANYFTIEFYDKDGVERIESKDGDATYRFTQSGTYLIKVKAHATYEYYIEKSDSVSVTVTQNNGGGNGGIPTTGYTTPDNYPDYTLVWQDEFNGSDLSSDWSYEIGTGNNGWGNNELQYYREENTEVKDGYLIITAKEESFGGRNYTSSRLVTRNMQSFKYGRIDIRAALPKGKGLWPALWMLGNSFGSVGWPACGEIDIMEMVGGNGNLEGDNYVHGTVHWEDNGNYASYGGKNKLPSGIYADEFHVFSIIWDADKIEWYRDDIKYHTIDITGAELSEFHENFFFIFNVAVGGNWPGSPNSSTQFPQQMAVDYVRVFQ